MSKFEEVMDWPTSRGEKSSLGTLHWLAEQQWLGETGQLPQTAVKLQAAVYQVLSCIWLGARSQITQAGVTKDAVDNATAALLVWARYIVPRGQGWKSWSRETVSQTLSDRGWVAENLGLSAADPFVKAVVERAGRFWSQGGISSKNFDTSRQGSLS